MIDRGEIGAAMANGVLTVIMPKVEEVKPRRIPVKVGE
jgi:HSP20 family molecular chaperone IbpA